MTADKAPPERARRATSTTALPAAVGLATVLVAAKAVYLVWQTATPPKGFADGIASLAAITTTDVVFAAAVGVVHALALRLARVLPSLRMPLRSLLFGSYLLAAAFAIANLSVFAFFRTPLTYSLFCFAGDTASFFALFSASLTPAVALALGGGIWLWGGTTLAVRRLTAGATPRQTRIGLALLAAVVVAWIAGGERRFAADWSERADRRIAANPHWTFLASTAKAMVGSSSLVMPETVLATDLTDFETVGERSARRRSLPLVKPVTLPHPAEPVLRNVIVVVLESVSARWLQPYGSPYPATPVLDAEARHSILFDAFYAPAGRSSDALAAMLLSTHPRISWRDLTVDYPALPGETLPEMLSQQGYRTGFITSSDLEWGDWRGFLHGRGFDQVREHRDLDCGPLLTYWGGQDRCLVDDMIRWLDEDSRQPFFLMGWTIQTHHPYETPKGQPELDLFAGRNPPDAYDLDRYLNALAETDRQLGRLFAALRASGRDRDTLVVIVGDHGEAFGDPRSIYGHGTTLYDEQMRVPLMLWSPALSAGGARSARVGGHVDLNHTIADLLALPPAESWQGRSLFDEDRPDRAYFSATATGLQLGIRERRWKYSFDAGSGEELLFDVVTDPDERRNLAAVRPDLCRRLRQRLAARLEADRRVYAPLRATGAAQPS